MKSSGAKCASLKAHGLMVSALRFPRPGLSASTISTALILIMRQSRALTIKWISMSMSLRRDWALSTSTRAFLPRKSLCSAAACPRIISLAAAPTSPLKWIPRAPRAFSIVHLNPYFTPDGVEQLTSAYYDTQKPLVSAGAGAEDFTINRIGGRLRFGIPFSEVDKVYFGLGFEQNRFKAYEQAPKRYQEYIQEFGRVVNSAPLTIGWARDARDHPTVPSRGILTRANFELGLPIASTKYYKIDLQQQYYYSFARGFVLGLNGELGYGRGLSGKPFPIFKNYYAGGIGSVRGYEPASLGPKDEDAQVAIGGAKSALVNAEISVPLPKTGFDRMLRVFAFVDAGNVWDE